MSLSVLILLLKFHIKGSGFPRSIEQTHQSWIMKYIFLILGLCFGSTSIRAFPMAECVADLCIRETNLSEKDLLLKFGNSKRKLETKQWFSHCYMFPQEKTGPIFGRINVMAWDKHWIVSSIKLSKKALCSKPEKSSYKGKILINNLIGIGSSIKEVIHAFGEPSQRITDFTSDMREFHAIDLAGGKLDGYLQYEGGKDELFFARFLYTSDKIVGIELSIEP